MDRDVSRLPSDISLNDSTSMIYYNYNLIVLKSTFVTLNTVNCYSRRTRVTRIVLLPIIKSQTFALIHQRKHE